MSHAFQLRPRHGRALAAILAVAAGSWLVASAADEATGTPQNARPDTAAAAPVTAPATTAANSTAAPANGTVVGAPTQQASGNSTLGPNGQMSAGDLRVLEGFLRLPPERITELRKALEYLEKMSPEERAALRRHVEDRNQKIQQVRQTIEVEYRQLAQPQRSVVDRYVMTLFPEDCAILLQRYQTATTTEQRKQIISEMLATADARGIKPRPPNPERGQQGGNRGGNQGQSGRGAGRRNGPPPFTVPAPAESAKPDNK